MTPSQASRVGTEIGLSWLSCPYCLASSRRGPKRVRSSSSDIGASRLPLGWWRYGRPSHSTVGITGTTRSGHTCAVPAASATFVTIFSALHRPDAREQATRSEEHTSELQSRQYLV